jgi:hypothetical protein
LRTELERIRELARVLNIESDAGRWTLDLLLSRFDAGPLKPLLLSVFGFIEGDPTLVSELNSLIDRCRKVDAALANSAMFAMRPRDRSFSGARADPLGTVQEALPQIYGCAALALAGLQRLKM